MPVGNIGDRVLVIRWLPHLYIIRMETWLLSNRVKGFHIGLNGSPTSEIDYRILVSVAKHWGTYGSPYRNIRRNQNGLLEVTYKPEQIRGWSFTLAGAVDGGNMLGESWGRYAHHS